jgi:hypothetical protein
MGATGVNQAASTDGKGTESTRAWELWTPVNAAAIGLHLLGGAGLMVINRGRVAAQKGVFGATTSKLVLTGAALAATGAARVLGQRLIKTKTPVEQDGVPLSVDAVSHTETARHNLKTLQWIIPALTGALVVMNAYMGEQQRPKSVAQGMLERIHLT